MEGEKKRKRAADGEAGGGGGSRRRKEREAKAEAAAAEPMPTDEEVDEFFAILRRMHAAAKYFEKGRGNAAGRKLTGRWATALEAEVLAGVNGAVKAAEESAFGARKNRAALDLNSVPEAESNSL
ncbi:hypothetical protein RHGRI_034681 [Rhododendron griersonianum]|uniref:Protein NEGATIVE REGULATOR OF RESISTANCE n=1 Tax=Rhododendron griersonianum TaxID=479676 RepID=A0AAV6I4E3_9ERIC|nr:hypothetical protein RHGRI_034681 [Rhododendron griersonianum]